MANPPKYIEHGSLYFVTSRTEEGLPFSDEGRFKLIAESIMARAQALYPVEIVAYDLGTNHFHLLLVPIDPAQFPLFVGYLKQELSHAVNRIKGIRKRTIWCDGYDSPVLMGYAEALHYLCYLYTQAQAAHQADTIEEKRGASSWKQFISGNYSRSFKRLLRTDFEDEIDLNEKEKEGRDEHTLVISPYGWLKRLAPDVSETELLKVVMDRVRALEAQYREERRSKGIRIYKGSSWERAKNYRPKKFGKRMICICWDNAERISFLSWFKDRVADCRRVFARWRVGDRSAPWPLGFFPPSMPQVAWALPGS